MALLQGNDDTGPTYSSQNQCAILIKPFLFESISDGMNYAINDPCVHVWLREKRERERVCVCMGERSSGEIVEGVLVLTTILLDLETKIIVSFCNRSLYLHSCLHCSAVYKECGCRCSRVEYIPDGCSIAACFFAPLNGSNDYY